MAKRYLLACIFLSGIIFGQDQLNSHVPGWAKTAIWYQIFPERFCNGDTLNDPTSNDMIGGWPYYVPDDWQIHPWTSDWYKLQQWETNTSKDFYWNSGLRRYGGDLQGIINKLDYLKNLGITAIYLNPVFESPSLHKYDATMYHHIDNNFGPNPDEDKEIWDTETPGDPSSWKWTTADKLFLTLIEKCHNRNIKIIIDGVFNHVGNTFWAFKDVMNYQEKSKYSSWFTINQWDNPETSENEFEYQGWYGVKDLPELKENKVGLIPEIQEHIKAVVKRWMDPNSDGDPSDGIDGWRLDVADMVNIQFWKTFRIWVKEINPEAYITGEVWWEDWTNNIIFNAAPWLKGDTFDSVMNYRFARAVKHFIANKEYRIGATGFIDSLKSIYNDYNPENLSVIQNLLDSHDTERFSSMIVNPDLSYDHGAKPSETKGWIVSAPNEEEYKKFRLAVALQIMLPGAPMIYYGDEVGMWGGDDPDCRKPMLWNELDYETEQVHPTGEVRDTNSVSINKNIFFWYQQLISIRNNNPEFSSLDCEFETEADDNVLIIKRFSKSRVSFIILNNSNQEYELNFSTNSFLGEKSFTSLLNNNTYDDSITILPYEVTILK